jgi:hypothetical protein
VRPVVIVNPYASRVTPRVVEEVERTLGRVETVYTEGPGHATQLTRDLGAEMIYVFSGDGGFNEALNGSDGGAALGFIPGGGTNVLPRALGLPRDPVAAARRLAHGRTRRISLGRVNGRRFGFSAGVGLDAELIRRVDALGRSREGARPGDRAFAAAAARLVAVLRHPVDRAWSHYWLNREKRRERLSFEDALAAEPERLATAPTPWTWAYVDRGRYVGQLQRLASLFPASQLRVLLFDDLKADPAGTFAAVARFVGVDDGVVPPAVGHKANAYRRIRSGRVADMTRRWPTRLRDAVGHLNTRPAAYPTMAPATRERLVAEFAEPTVELAQWLGRDLSAWSR